MKTTGITRRVQRTDSLVPILGRAPSLPPLPVGEVTELEFETEHRSFEDRDLDYYGDYFNQLSFRTE